MPLLPLYDTYLEKNENSFLSKPEKDSWNEEAEIQFVLDEELMKDKGLMRSVDGRRVRFRKILSKQNCRARHFQRRYTLPLLFGW
jgi:hypothetical protein